MLLLFALEVPYVQRALSAFVSEALSEKLGTQVRVGRVEFGLPSRLVIGDLKINDQTEHTLFESRKVAVRFDLASLVKGPLTVRSCKIVEGRAHLKRATPHAPYNFQFLVDSLSSRSEGPSRLNLRLKSLILTHCALTHDLAYRAATPKHFNTAHLALEDIGANISLKLLRPDSLNLLVRHLTAKEKSGPQLSSLFFHLTAGRHGASIYRLEAHTPQSRLRLNHITAHYDPDLSFRHYTLAIGEAQGRLNPAELTPFINVRQELPSRHYTFSTQVHITEQSSALRGVNIKRGAHLALQGRLHVRKAAGRSLSCDVRVPKLHVDKEEWQAWLPLLGPKAQLPAPLERLGTIDAALALTKAPDQWSGNASLSTGLGHVKVQAVQKGRNLSAQATGRCLDVGQLPGLPITLGAVPFELQANLLLSPLGRPLSAQARLSMTQAEINQHTYQSIQADARYDAGQQHLAFSTQVADPQAELTARGSYKAGTRTLNLESHVATLSLPALGLNKESLNGSVSGRFELQAYHEAGKPYGSFMAQNVHIRKDTTNFLIHQLQASATPAHQGTNMTLDCDFLHAQVQGRLQPATLPADLFALLRRNTFPESAARGGSNHFSFRFKLLNSHFIEQILGKSLHTEGTALASGYLDAPTGRLMIEGSLPRLTLGGQTFRNLSTYCKADGSSLSLLAQATRRVGQSDVKLVAEAHNEAEALLAGVEWKNDHGAEYSGHLNTRTHFLPHGRTHTTIEPSLLTIEDSVWHVASASIDHQGGHVQVNNFKLYRDGRHVALSGSLSPTRTDSLLVDVERVRLERVFDLLNFHPVDFAGEATGRALIKHPFSNPEAGARLHVKDFNFNGADLGLALITARWNPQTKHVNIDASMADAAGRQTGVRGFVDVGGDGLDLHFAALRTNVEFLNSFLPDVLADVSGTYEGNLRLYGPFDRMQIEGDGVAALKLKAAPLNTYFSVPGDSVHFNADHISLPRVRFADMEGHTGTLSGDIWHNRLHDFRYRFDLRTNNMMVFDGTPEDGRSFWGRVYATGTALLTGEPGLFSATLNMRPEARSLFTYNADWSENTEENSYVTFRDRSRTPADSTPATAALGEPDEDEAPTDVHLDLTLDMHPDAGLNVIMDNRTNNVLSLYGSGLLRANYYNKGNFEMYGTYTLDHGTYDLVVQNVIRKPFVFGSGGRIVFGGSPARADLDLQASYTLPSVPLSDLSPGGSMAGKNVRVNCLLNFTGTVGSPQVHFGLDVPNVNDEEKQMIRSLINTDEDLNMQVAYLLSVGRFYAYDAPAGSGTQQRGSATAMNSILSGTLSTQLNSILSSTLKNRHWSLGTNLQTGTDGWNDMEVEGLFSGRFLSGRLLLNGMLGYRDQQLYNQTNFIGDFSLEYLLNPRGTIRLKAYSEENDRYFTRTSLTTQGGGIRVQKDFSRLSDLFFWKKKKNRKK